MSGFDARALTAPVDRQAVKAFTRANPQNRNTVGIIVMFVVLGALALVVLPVLFTAIVGIAMAGGALFVIVPVLVFLGVLGVIIWFIVRAILGSGERAYRLASFSQANGMHYVGRVPDPALPGMIFSLGSSRGATDAVRGERPRFAEFANYSYTTGSGKNRTTHKWGYIAIKLNVPLPHIVLDALGNNGLFGASNLPANFDRDQHLSLEGDFDRYFSLYCPRGYERDALYLFTPDVMARFIDNAGAVDVEIVDDWLFFYARRDFVTLDPAMWAWLFSVVGAILQKIDQWERWRDDRTAEAPAVAASAVPFGTPTEMLAPPTVAPQGRRLRRKFPWAAIVVLIGFGVVWLVIQTGILGILFQGF